MRLFLAIPLNNEMKNAVNEIQSHFIRRGIRGNYTRPENLHLTLAFIGEYSDPEFVMESISDIQFSPFPLSLSGFGAFGDLWWIGITESEELTSLVRRIRRALAEAEIPYDRKRFSPHITVLRKANGKIPGLTIPEAGMLVEHFSLMRSDRGKNGMIYTEIGKIGTER